MIEKEESGIRWLEFEQLQEFANLVHGCFLRHGGVSDAPYDSLNMSTAVGDNLEHVDENKKRAAQSLEQERLAWSIGVHSTKIIDVTAPTPNPVPGCDGLVTQTSNVPLLMTHADCQVAIFYDPTKKVVANIHAGWRGSVQNIYRATIAHMHARYGCQSENLLVSISPSLGPEEAEFINFEEELPKSFWEHQIRPTYFDFWEISTRQLTEAGILPHHIEIARIATVANPADFFSYRRDKTTGRNGTIVALT